MNWLFALMGTTLVFLAIAYVVTGRDLFSPSVIVCGVFLVSETFAAFNIQKWNIQYSAKAYLLLALGLFLFVAADTIAATYFSAWPGTAPRRPNAAPTGTVAGWKFYLTIAVDAAVFALYYLDLIQIAAIAGGEGSLSSILKERTYSDMSVAESLSPMVTMLIKIPLATAYVFTYALLKRLATRGTIALRRMPWHYLLPAALYLAMMLLSGERIHLLYYCAFSITVAYVLTQRQKGWTTAVSKRFLWVGAGALVVLFGLFYALMGILGRDNGSLGLFDYISIYAGGSIQQFNQYVRAGMTRSDLWGRECFISIYQFLWKLGLYPDFISPHLEFRILFRIGTSELTKYGGNVYTFFRAPLADFGIGGMIVVTLACASGYALFYHGVLKRRTGSDISLILYAYLFSLVFMVSIANQITGILSFYYVANSVLMALCYGFLIDDGFLKRVWARILAYKPARQRSLLFSKIRKDR